MCVCYLPRQHARNVGLASNINQPPACAVLQKHWFCFWCCSLITIMQYVLLLVLMSLLLLLLLLVVAACRVVTAPGGRSGRRLAGRQEQGVAASRRWRGSLTMLIVHDHVVTIRRAAWCVLVRRHGALPAPPSFGLSPFNVLFVFFFL